MANPTVIQALSLTLAANVPVILWGPPGTGKTETITRIAAAQRLPLETVIAALREPSDFAGLPVILDGEVHLAPPRWASALARAGTGIVFFDELSTAPPSVQAALLRVPIDRVVGDLALPPEIRVVAAANPPETTAGSWELSAPTANRFCHLPWHPTGTDVAAGFVGGFPTPDLPKLGRGWERNVPRHRAHIGSFLHVRPELAVDLPDDLGRAGGAWPSPRTWEMAARLAAASHAAGAGPEVRAALLGGAVGEAAALELVAWESDLDLPDPEVILADPDALRIPRRGDRAFAILSAVTAAVVADNTPERWAAGWAVVRRYVDTGKPDIAAVGARQLARHRPKGARLTDDVSALLPLLEATSLAD